MVKYNTVPKTIAQRLSSGGVNQINAKDIIELQHVIQKKLLIFPIENTADVYTVVTSTKAENMSHVFK